MATTDTPGYRIPVRKASGWAAPRGFNYETVPWRLYEKAKQLVWDPADLDLSGDATEWATLNTGRKAALAGLARGFMIGEEGVTLDIVPLMLAMGDQGRTEEVMYLTTFAFEEAKHVDFFRRWFDAIGVDQAEMDRLAAEDAAYRGVTLPDPHRTVGMFESELPRVMRRLLTDTSPEAILDASVTYNQFVEGCLAISGYRVWGEMFQAFGVLHGLQKGLRYIRQDEGRHITYGTYLCRRLIAANPDLLDFARNRLRELLAFYEDTQEMPAEEEPTSVDLQGPTFRALVHQQVEARIQVLERAALLSEEEAEGDHIAEEVEAELSGV